ncbi:hypothetical protein ABZW47_26290 [Streptomyces sp. NPDC004549]|uniref:hypothetical protein n=1 Tax=Streptomyces sp. NPDC004549 TaxID=3154283 RepID=UPI001F5B11BD|nr:hypothetical protein [Streptomyces sp. DSM 110735]
MTPMHTATGRQRRPLVPRPAEPAAPQPPQDPPIYREMMRTWADRGRTLPGRHDPEWVELAAPQVVRGQFSEPQGPPHDGR